MKIKCIRTGGQSGADRAAMDIARKYHIPLCGWCPKGGWAEDYPDSPGILAEYPEMQETPSSGTAERTTWNMRDADAILTIIPRVSAESAGTMLGVQAGEAYGKPMYTAAGPEEIPAILAWLNTLPNQLELSVGGPRASECSTAYEVTWKILEGLIERFQ